MTDSISAQQADHPVYETHCALAATGQLSQKDRIALDTHCRHCASCRHRLQDMSFIGREVILNAANKEAGTPMPAGSLERFVLRALDEGIALRTAPRMPSIHTWAPVLLALTVFAVSLISMTRRRTAPTNDPIFAKAIATSDVDTQPRTYKPSSPIDRQNQHRTTLHIKPPMRAKLAPAAPVSSAGQWATLAPERFTQAIPSAYTFFESHPTPPQAVAYPTLSRAQVLHLALFRNALEPSTQPSLGIATLYRPDALFPADRSFDFAPDMRQLRFQLPTNQ